jgi:hypothetical protein
MELDEEHVQWHVLMLALLNLQVLSKCWLLSSVIVRVVSQGPHSELDMYLW